MTSKAEIHPLPPFLPENARLLMLGSFPPARVRWSMDFFYPNLQNDMWRIMGIVFFNEKEYFVRPDKKGFDQERIERFLKEKGIALSDTATEVVRLKGNASDKFLEIVEAIDLVSVLEKLPECQAIAVTGQKAMDTLLQIVDTSEPPVGKSVSFIFNNRTLELFRMPSSSRAYPKPLTEKASVYSSMFKKLGMIF